MAFEDATAGVPSKSRHPRRKCAHDRFIFLRKATSSRAVASVAFDGLLSFKPVMTRFSTARAADRREPGDAVLRLVHAPSPVTRQATAVSRHNCPHPQAGVDQ